MYYVSCEISASPSTSLLLLGPAHRLDGCNWCGASCQPITAYHYTICAFLLGLLGEGFLASWPGKLWWELNVPVSDFEIWNQFQHRFPPISFIICLFCQSFWIDCSLLALTSLQLTAACCTFFCSGMYLENLKKSLNFLRYFPFP